MSQEQRERALQDFNRRAECRVMVISLKAGGVGLNLTAASIVFLLDPWWCDITHHTHSTSSAGKGPD